MRPIGTPEALEARRRLAARLFAQGKSLAKVAAAVGSSLSSASRWKQAWRHGGVRTLRSKPHPGREPKLSPIQQRKLKAALRLGSGYWGYAAAENPEVVARLQKLAEEAREDLGDAHQKHPGKNRRPAGKLEP